MNGIKLTTGHHYQITMRNNIHVGRTLTNEVTGMVYFHNAVSNVLSMSLAEGMLHLDGNDIVAVMEKTV